MSKDDMSKLIFPCSGAADVGNIADLTARKLTKEGTGRMFCMAGIGGNVEKIIRITREASKILAIDGCPLNCVKSSLQRAGFDNFEHFTVTNLGMKKGSTSVTDENVATVKAKAEVLLRD
ncbi:putative zinc-binding protein [Anaerolineales bacterium HSG24]|nr:putative zinc-binding protein [Anaerolineales bacterium HSG24]